MSVDTPALVDENTMTRVAPYEDVDDGNQHHTHIVRPPENKHIFLPGMDARDIVNLARDWGVEVVALCGYRWVPKRNPDKYPACQPCMDVAGMIMREEGE